MLDGPHIAVLIQEKTGAPDRSPGLAILSIDGVVGSGVLKTDCPHPFFRQGIKLLVPLFIRHPDLQFIPDFIPLINKAIMVCVIGCKVRKPIAGFGAKKLRPVVDDASAR